MNPIKWLLKKFPMPYLEETSDPRIFYQPGFRTYGSVEYDKDGKIIEFYPMGSFDATRTALDASEAREANKK